MLSSFHRRRRYESRLRAPCKRHHIAASSHLHCRSARRSSVSATQSRCSAGDLQAAENVRMIYHPGHSVLSHVPCLVFSGRRARSEILLAVIPIGDHSSITGVRLVSRPPTPWGRCCATSVHGTNTCLFSSVVPEQQTSNKDLQVSRSPPMSRPRPVASRYSTDAAYSDEVQGCTCRDSFRTTAAPTISKIKSSSMLLTPPRFSTFQVSSVDIVRIDVRLRITMHGKPS